MWRPFRLRNRKKQKTRVICSLDSHNLSEDYAKTLAKNSEVSCIRIVYNPQKTKEILKFIASFNHHSSKNPNHHVTVMIDVGSLPRGVINFTKFEKLEYGQTLSISKIGGGGDIELEVYEKWSHLFALDKIVFFGFGSIECVVTDILKNVINVKVVKGGDLTPGTAVHVPTTRKAPSIFDLSYIDIKPFQELKVSYVVLPGIRTAREVAVARKKLKSIAGTCPWLIIRVDHLDVYKNISEILKEADGVFISRRELALTMNAATVPMVCKEVIRESNEKAKLVIIASEMLASLQFNPTPTRAEVSDVANAVIDGTDAVVLSEDISHGKYLIKSVNLCQSIILDVEEEAGVEENWTKQDLGIKNELDAVTYHAFKTAQRVQAKAIVCVTKEGNTALRLASFKIPMPIIAVTFSELVKSRLSLVRGVESIVLNVDPSLDELLPTVNKLLIRDGWLRSGDKIVFVTVTLSSIGREASNLFTIQNLNKVQ